MSGTVEKVNGFIEQDCCEKAVVMCTLGLSCLFIHAGGLFMFEVVGFYFASLFELVCWFNTCTVCCYMLLVSFYLLP